MYIKFYTKAGFEPTIHLRLRSQVWSGIIFFNIDFSDVVVTELDKWFLTEMVDENRNDKILRLVNKYKEEALIPMKVSLNQSKI